MAAAGVRTAVSEIVDTPARLDAALARFTPPYVVKDDGLAAGKGVVVSPDYRRRPRARLHAARRGHPVLLEAFLDGPEVSLFCLVDGETVVPLVPAQDFKNVGDGDSGPNTGGMGAYAPLPWAPRGSPTSSWPTSWPRSRPSCTGAAPRSPGSFTRGWRSRRPARRSWSSTAASATRRPRSCCPLLRTPLAGLLHATATGALAAQPPLQWADGAAVTVVVAAEGYPGPPRLGDIITGAEADGVLHAGTRRRDDEAVVAAAGGRVLSVLGTGPDLAAARETPTAAWRTSTWRARTTAPTSPSAPRRVRCRCPPRPRLGT